MYDKKNAVRRVALFLLCVCGCIDTVSAQAQAVTLQHQEISLSRQESIEQARTYHSQAEKLLEEENYPAADERLKKAQQLLEDAGLDALKEFNPQPAAEMPENPGSALESSASLSVEEMTLSQRAWALSQRGESQEAINYYLKAIALYPKAGDLHYNLAIEYIKTGQFDLALKALEEAVALNPKDCNAYYNLGAIYENQLNDKKRALAYYKKYMKYAPLGKDETVAMWIKEISRQLGD
jgi:tetratricopeptide (TPR) repeat protein